MLRSHKRLLLLLGLPIVLLMAGCGHHAPGRATVTPPPARPTVTLPRQTGCGPGLYATPYGCQAHNPKVFQAAARVLPNAGAAPQATGLVTMFDSTDPWPNTPIPGNATYVAGYVNGRYQTYRSYLGHFPVVVGISVASDNATSGGADCFDMEPGNPGPQNAGPWAHWQFSQGNTRPCEYFMLSWRSQVEQSLAQWHIPVCSTGTQNFCVREWTANWTFSPHIDPGATCTQWTDHGPSGENYDQSLCYASFFQRSVPPKPKPPADPHHYNWFPTSPTVAGGLTERHTIVSYDGARQHPAKYAGWLKALEHWLNTDASRVAWLASNVWGTSTHPNWSLNHAGWRYQELTHRAQGLACTATSDPCEVPR